MEQHQTTINLAEVDCTSAMAGDLLLRDFAVLS